MNKTTKRLKYFVGIFLIGITLIAFVFPFQIHIMDMLTLKALPEYSIHISIGRILLEPIIGLLLFFNRSYFAIAELQYLLGWILAIFIAYPIFHFFKREKQAKKGFILNQIVYAPIILGLWITFFAIMLFIPLPNNTIVNNAQHSVLVTTHSHSKYSHDGLIGQRGLWKWHKRNGFDAFFITDHNNHNKTLDLVAAQRNGAFPIEPLIMCGEEFSGSNHLSLLGLKRKFNTKNYPDSTTVDSVHANKGVVIVNHWFDAEHKTLDYYKNLGVAGFEIENAGKDLTYNRKLYKKIRNFCERNHLIMIGGLDFHGYGHACMMWNALEIPNWKNLTPPAKEEAILAIFRSREQSKLKILFYKDRPYYGKNNLALRPIFTLFNYFRTLNVFQLLSWAFWVLLFLGFKIKIWENPVFKNQISANKLMPIVGLLCASFLWGLGLFYFFKIEKIDGYSELYEEYSTLLFYIGSVFLVYSIFVRRGRLRSLTR